jgi:hypothetical protein
MADYLSNGVSRGQLKYSFEMTICQAVCRDHKQNPGIGTEAEVLLALVLIGGRVELLRYRYRSSSSHEYRRSVEVV